MVFVHGVRSSARVWDGFASVMAQDEELSRLVCEPEQRFEYATATFGPLKPSKTLPSISTAADTMREYLLTEADNFERLVLVGHSQGGLVIQRYLERMLADGRGLELARIRRVVLLATPNTGSQLLSTLRRFLVHRHPQEVELRPFNELVNDAARRVHRDIVNAPLVPTERTCRIPFSVYAGSTDGVVTRASAQAMFPDASALPGDHKSIVAVDSPRHATYATVRRLLLQAATTVDPDPPPDTGAQARDGRCDLAGATLPRSSTHAQAWRVLDALSRRLRDRTRATLSDGLASLTLARSAACETLSAKMTTVGMSPGALVVTGEPGAGKSALTLQAAQQLTEDEWAVNTLSLSGLPDSVLDLESRLGAMLTEVLASTAVGRGRLLVLDGCESVLAGRDQLLTEIATTALRAGLGIVCVTRNDGRKQTTACLNRALEVANRPETVTEYEVADLEPTEVDQISASFPRLAGLVGDTRTAWILARPGLVDLLLRSDATIDADGLVSEADVLVAVWRGWVRHDEIARPGCGTPDDRERTMLWLARQQLGLDPGDLPSSRALASLRSDGLLLVPDPTSAWGPGDEFATDIIKDFAVAVLLAAHGFGLLTQADGSRWALRATRLACQLRLAKGPNARAALRQIRTDLEDVASKHGQRWAELPWEALLTFRTAQSTMAAVWPDLIADDSVALRILVRLALQRYVRLGIGDPIVLEPLVALIFCREHDLGHERSYDQNEFTRQTQRIVLAYLRGLIAEGRPRHGLRRQVRDALIERYAPAREEFAIEALATLGPDLDDRVETFFMDLVNDGGFELGPAVEESGATAALSQHQPDLLLTLAEAYYIDHRHTELGIDFEGGIRSHQAGGSLNDPMAAWCYGPFFHLLRTRPAQTFALINRILDHAAAIEATPHTLSYSAQPQQETAEGLELDLLGDGQRWYVGDVGVWCWYRGSSAGPPPCISALLAVERFADHLLDDRGVPLADLAGALLRDCGNLAMPALVIGLFVRRLETAGELLDSWLTNPELWQLENARVVHEAIMHVQGQDAADLTGIERRRLSFGDVASEMTVRALLARDSMRLAQLNEIGDELLRCANSGYNATTPERLQVVEIWASLFRPENYPIVQEGSDRFIQYKHPAHIAEAIAPKLNDVAHGSEAMRLQNTYAPPVGPPEVVDIHALALDIATARRLAADPPDSGPLYAADPVVAVAATAILAAADNRVALSEDDLRWAAEAIVDAANSPFIDAMAYDSTVYPMGADRSAAAALPALLLLGFDDLAIDRDQLTNALLASSTSRSNEVRLALAHGTYRVWTAPCRKSAGPAPCHHELLWNVVQAGLQDCRLGSWDLRTQRRPIEHLPGPYEQTLPDVATEDLLLSRLDAPLVATAPASYTSSCVSGAAGRLLEVLVETRSRVARHWKAKRYATHGDRQRLAVARALVQTSVAGSPEPLEAYVMSLCPDEAVLSETLRDLALVFTYDAALRRSLLPQWRRIMIIVLDAAEAGVAMHDEQGRHYDRAVEMLLPTPQVDLMDSDVDTTLGTARSGWIDPEAIADLFTRWLPFAQRDPQSADGVAQLARCASVSWQTATGLLWVELVLDGNYKAVARHSYFLPGWLSEVANHPMSPEERARWRRIVDGLAAAGDRRAVALQKADE
ncbi:hypothetical protein [Catenulispora yoronensis]|uniref:hypothetical protein n=1 Tax=Catenulispora yoronensis TaxID=450799 RepID=UPI0031DCF034